MYISVNSSMFFDAFRRMGREDQFSCEALEALFEHLENYEQETGAHLELDVIAMCCDYTEYETALEAAADYGFTSDLEADDFEDAREEEALEWLRDRTEVISFDSGLIIQNF